MGANKWEDTYNPYPEEERTKVPLEAWIFTERLRFTNGVNNSAISVWEQHLAKISFKAGVKEVVEFVKSFETSFISSGQWQAFLKERLEK